MGERIGQGGRGGVVGERTEGKEEGGGRGKREELEGRGGRCRAEQGISERRREGVRATSWQQNVVGSVEE